jgi:hypothetical protein
MSVLVQSGVNVLAVIQTSLMYNTVPFKQEFSTVTSYHDFLLYLIRKDFSFWLTNLAHCHYYVAEEGRRTLTDWTSYQGIPA